MSASSADDELELGEIEAGESPSRRKVKPGAHPWSPSALEEYDARQE